MDDDLLIEGYKSIGEDDIELAEQFLNASRDTIPSWDSKELKILKKEQGK